MRKILYLLMCPLLFLFLCGIAHAGDIHVVHKPDTTPCTTGDFYHTSIQDAVDAIKSDVDPVTGCYPDNDSDGEPDHQDGKSIIICPSDTPYVENVVMIFAEACTPAPNMTIRSYTNNPNDVTVEAADPSMNVFYLHGPGLDGITVSGLTIKGAIDNPSNPQCTINCNPNNCPPENPNCCDGQCIPCLNFYNNLGTPIYSNQDPPQHCAGIRVFCMITGYLNNNIFTDNNHGIIIKDTAPDWDFFFRIENNEFYDNKTAGINFRYGTDSFVQHNQIHHNPIGVKLTDTFDHNIVGNDIEYNDIGISLESNYYIPDSTIFYFNNFSNNTTQVLEDDVAYNYWYEPALLIGNYWLPGLSTYPYDLYPLASPYVDGNDLDNDGFENHNDNCPNVFNPGQDDVNTNGMGDACDNCSGESHVRRMDSNKYPTLQDAFNEPDKKLFILTQAAVITENIDVDIEEHYTEIATLSPGYDCNYTANNGKTTLNGNMKISSGALRIKNGALSIK